MQVTLCVSWSEKLQLSQCPWPDAASTSFHLSPSCYYEKAGRVLWEYLHIHDLDPTVNNFLRVSYRIALHPPKPPSRYKTEKFPYSPFTIRQLLFGLDQHR